MGSGIDAYLKPPKLSEQHEQIYNALIKAEGSKINLKYPRSGSYLSAFVVSNIDDEPSDEAIVFYEKKSLTESDIPALRINLLDQKDGRWESVYDFSTDGTDVDRVFISDLGESDRINIIVGISNQTEKNALMFNYNGVSTESPQLLGSYSIMDVRDINNDDSNELLMISSTAVNNVAQLKWLDRDNTLVSGPGLNLTENSTDISQLIYGRINNNLTAVYLDSYVSTNTIMTEIFYAEKTKDTIYLKPLSVENQETDVINKTVRPSSLTSKDIDSDGVVEIPINTIFTGYEDKPETEQIPMTNWYTYENNMLTRKYCGYYSITDGYCFMLPMRWIDQVTVKIVNEDVVFCKYDPSSDSSTELMKICVVDKEEAQKIMNDNHYEQYEQIYSYGDTVYLVCIPENENEPLVPTISEVQFNFKLTA
ncbi:MAG: hypothetical protein Q4F95_12145 [Oscillospiraceae bacterium]|nr:hypothetical protein [Oscillospiraceae bacterium]